MDKKKRGVGERSRVIIDTIDLDILDILNMSKNQNGLGVMELKEEIGIAHNSLKPHIEKLIKLGLISFEQVKKSRKIILKSTNQGKEILYLFFYRKPLKTKKKDNK